MYSELFLVACISCLIKFLLLLLLALLLGLLAGWWLWGQYKKMVSGLNGEIKGLKNKLNKRDKEFASLKYAHDELEKDNSGMRSSLAGCEGDRAALQASLNRSKTEMAAMAAASAGAASMSTGIAAEEVETPPEPEEKPDIVLAKTPEPAKEMFGFGAYGNYFANDNLQIIEGIGPKISRTLHAAGVNTWGALAGKTALELEAILTDAKISTKINNPKTWPEQARLANEGEWEELVKYQKFLDTGVENKGSMETPAKVEKLYLKAIGFAGAKPENLKVVEGIGPKIEGLLKDGGIQNWSDLAACEVSKIQDILNAAGPRYKLANPATWPRQAELAANAQWNELKGYQDSLNGGK